MSSAVSARRRAAPRHARQPSMRLLRWVPAPEYVLGLAALAIYTAYGVLRYLHFLSGGMDLGLFTQEVADYAHLQAPISTMKAPDFNLLGDHFSPINAIIAPFYRLVPSPLTLQVAQAVLLAVSVVVVTRAARGFLGSGAAWLLGAAYALSWGLQSLADFDFHEVAFAVPLLALAMVAYLREHWWACAAWTVPLVLVKEDLPATVVIMGLLLPLRRQWKPGLFLVGFGVATGLLIVLVIMPAFAFWGHYVYSGTLLHGNGGGSRTFASVLRPPWKWELLGWTFLPTGFLALASPLAVLAVPTLAWRLASSHPSYWVAHFQYSAVLMPIVFVAAIDTLRRMRDHGWLYLRGFARAVPALCLAGALVALHLQPLWNLARPGFWQDPPRASAARDAVAAVPRGATVLATNHLAVHLVNRATVYLLRSAAVPDSKPIPATWLAADVRIDDGPMDAALQAGLVDRLRTRGCATVFDRDGYVVMHCAAPVAEALWPSP